MLVAKLNTCGYRKVCFLTVSIGERSLNELMAKGNVNLLPIPDNVTDEQALYLSDILPTSYHAVVDTGVEQGDTVAIWGLGPIGLLVAHWAKFKGASRVIGIDRVPERLAFAQEKLNIDTINFSEHKDVPKRIREIVGEKGVDVCIDAGTFHEPKTIGHKIQKFLMLETDVPETINEMLIAVRKMGRVGLIAAYAGYANQVNVGALMEKGIRYVLLSTSRDCLFISTVGSLGMVKPPFTSIGMKSCSISRTVRWILPCASLASFTGST